MRVTSPRPFPGTAEQAAANHLTHQFDYESARCWNCDCRPWGVWASWPCGIDPNEVGYVTSDTAMEDFHAGFALHAAIHNHSNG